MILNCHSGFYSSIRILHEPHVHPMNYFMLNRSKYCTLFIKLRSPILFDALCKAQNITTLLSFVETWLMQSKLLALIKFGSNSENQLILDTRFQHKLAYEHKEGKKSPKYNKCPLKVHDSNSLISFTLII